MWTWSLVAVLHPYQVSILQEGGKVKFTCAKTMSASRVENADDMAVDDAEVALPTAEWLQAAQRAAETDGILENTSAKRQKVCKSCHTLTSPAHANHAQECEAASHVPTDGRIRGLTVLLRMVYGLSLIHI